MSLPEALDEASYESIERDSEVYLEAARQIGERHGALGVVRRFSTGSLPVLELGEEHVVKLFPQVWLDESDHEAAVLRAIEPVGLAPRVVALGNLDGWAYLLMTRARGRSLAELWGELEAPAKRDIVRQVGRWLRRLHELPVEGAPSVLDWEPFLAGQLKGCAERQRSLGLAREWADGLETFLGASGVAARTPRALMHTELMPDHLTVEPEGEGWRLAGVVDFEPAMVGDPEYELASFAAFFFRGEVELFGALEEGYGGFDPGWRTRALAYTCLHRYAHVPRYLEWIPIEGCPTFDALEASWFGKD